MVYYKMMKPGGRITTAIDTFIMQWVVAGDLNILRTTEDMVNAGELDPTYLDKWDHSKRMFRDRTVEEVGKAEFANRCYSAVLEALEQTLLTEVELKQLNEQRGRL